MEENKLKVFAHGSYIGYGGYNQHTRDFFRHLSKLIDVKVRNFTVGDNWDGNSDEQHNSEEYIDDLDKKLLTGQTLWHDQSNGIRFDHKVYSNYKNEFEHNVNIILQETNHNYYWDDYTGPKIGYNVWESTLQPDHFFNKLKTYDQIWVPSKWQAECTIKQGADKDKVKVVPEGVDINIFNLEKDYKVQPEYDGRFKFVLFGRWDYRKSTKEIIETFLKTFHKDDPVDLILSVDNKFGFYADGCNSTKERFEKYGIPLDPRLKFKSFVSREDYISYLKEGHVFLSCARSEGWNLPLIEAMSCGTPSIYSNCSAQLEFAEGKGLPVKIVGEKPCQNNSYDNDGYTHSLKDGVKTGNYYEPDFEDLSLVMLDAYKNYDSHKKRAIKDAKIIHKDFNWDRVAEIGKDTLLEFISSYDKDKDDNKIEISFTPVPKVEIIGEQSKKYEVKFINSDTNKVVFNDIIGNNMWCALSPEDFNNSLKVLIDGVEVDSVYDRLKKNNLLSKNVNGEKRHLIDLHSNSLGDLICIMPYLDLYRKKYNVKVYLRGPAHFSKLFVKSYPDITLTKENTTGFNNAFEKIIHIKHDFSKPLQQYFAENLGFKDYTYIRPKIDSFKTKRPIKNKYITFGIHSTAQLKYWNHKDDDRVKSTNWNDLCKLLRKEKITPVCLELHEKYGLSSNFNDLPNRSVNKVGLPLEEVLNYIEHSEFYIGLSSGMAWVAHALGKPVAMIANFTEDWNEFDINCKDYKRITNKSVCSGCWNDPKNNFNITDWEWCPEHRDTNRQFECHTSITPEQVFNEIKEWI